MLLKYIVFLPIIIVIIFRQIQKNNRSFKRRLVILVISSAILHGFLNALAYGFQLSAPILLLAFIIGHSGFAFIVCLIISYFLSKAGKVQFHNFLADSWIVLSIISNIGIHIN